MIDPMSCYAIGVDACYALCVMSDMINSPSHAIELLGGRKAVAGLIERPLTTVASWETRASIPVDVWPQLIKLANKKHLDGFTYESLALAHAVPVPHKPAKRKAGTTA